MKPLSLAALLISINLSFVNANPFEDEHRSLLSGGEAAAEVSVVEKYTCKSIIAIGKIRDSGGKEGVETTDNTDVSNKQGRRSLRKGEEKNSAHRNKEDKPHEPDEDFVCELEDGSVMTIEATDEQLREMRSALRDGNLVSQISTMDVDIMAQPPEDQLHAMIGGEAIIAGVNGDEKKAAKLPPGSIKLRTKKRRLAEHAQRRLGTLFRTNRMLVILVNDIDDKKPPFGADETSDKIFGTYGDPENPSVQLTGCSNNQTSLTPDSGDPAINALMDAPGVVEVDIAISIRPFDGATIENAAIEAANEKLGIRLPGMFDFVAIVIEDCLDSNECGFAAYAYLNSWKSLYVKDYYTYPAIITHELGHNVNLGHSGLARTYDDWSCSMGNPLWADHLDKMCFNPAKNWQIAHHGAWYVEHKLLLDPKTTPVSSHRLVGVSEYGLIESSYPTALAVMKLETHTSTDFFVGFNRANRQNADNRLASNEVTLITAGNNGEGYSESTFIAGLKQGESYAITDFGGSNEDLTVTVNKIDTSSSPGYADVSIVFGDGSSTPAPTPSCSGKWLKVAVDTDNYPSETSWEVLDKCDNDAVVMSVVEGQYTKAGERYEKDECVADSRYEFIIHDEFGDGVCCSWGSGAYTVEYGNKVVVSGGEFGVYDKITFGSCIDSPTTAQPTNKPTTSSPTKAPATPEPTAAPTNVPTKAPITPPPSAKPTSEPTAAPTTNAPTKVPATPPPSAKPTSEPSAAPTTHAPTKAPVTPLPTALPTAMPTSQPTPKDVGDDSGGGTFKEYTTPNIGEANDKAKGVIFTITAKSRDVIITALGIVGVGKDAKNSDVQVYCHSGSYEAFPDDRRERGKKGRGRGRGKRSSRLFRSSVAAWDEYFEDKVMLNPQEIVNVELDEEITIPAGGTVSVYVLSKKGVSYKASDSNEFDGYAESDDFVLKVGTATKKEFKQTEKLADFAGRIVYETGIAA